MDIARSQTNLIQDTLLVMGEVLHALQGERGCASLYLDCDDDLFKPKFQEQIDESDQKIEALQALIGDFSTIHYLPDYTEARLSALLGRLSVLDKLRASIFNKSLKYTVAINTYTFSHNLPLIDDMIELAQRTEEHNSVLVSAFANFLQWKERIGRERALGTRGFYSFAFRNPEFCDRMIALTAEQQTYLDSFMSIASPNQIAVVKSILDGSDMKELLAFHQKLENNSAPSELEKFTAESWFDMLSRTIDQLHIAEKKLTLTLGSIHDHEGGLHHGEIDSGIKLQKPFLQSLPLFSKLSDDELDDLLSFAQIRKFERGKLLFLQGEATQRLYVILKGWVKVFNGTESGDETILQMLSAGDTLLEAAIFLNTPAPVSAQLIEDATLLSIPAPVIRQKVKNNGNLAISMLSNVSLRSQRLIHQIEQSRLKTARERVGWFLLRLYLSQSDRTNTIYLPYDKSIIASYLDMRPETFSRTLKKLRDDGFEILKDRINMPHEKSLCRYCDSHLAGSCEFVGTPNCANPNVVDIDLLDVAGE